MKRIPLLLLAIVALSGCPKVARAQVPVTISPVPRQQFFSASGVPLANGCIQTYNSGTSTPAPTYTDQTGNFVASNPILLDGGGFASIWLAAQAYRFVLFSAGGVNCATGAQQWLIDGINPAPFLGGANAWTGAQSFTGTSTFNGAVNINAGGTLTGAFTGSPTFSGNPTFTGTPVFTNLQNFPLGISGDIINGTLTNGGIFTMLMAQGTGASTGEGFSLTAGAGPSGGSAAGGNVRLAAGAGGTTGGTGGIASLLGGNASSGNSAGGPVTLTGGLATGTGIGGAITLTAGNGGTTAGAGGGISLIAGGGGAGGIGGDVVITPGAGSGAANGSVKMTYGRLMATSTVLPTCSATGMGATATCAAYNGSGDSWGMLVVTAAGAGLAATGTITLTFNHSMGGGSGSVCTWNLAAAGGGSWNARATIMPTGPAALNATANWDNNSVAVTATTWDFTYSCVGVG